jgi:hypothetical protein
MKLTHQPTFALGDTVIHRVEADVGGVKIAQDVALVVVGLRLTSSSERHTFAYDLSTDPPQPYHYGSGVQFTAIPEEKLAPKGDA